MEWALISTEYCVRKKTSWSCFLLFFDRSSVVLEEGGGAPVQFPASAPYAASRWSCTAAWGSRSPSAIEAGIGTGCGCICTRMQSWYVKFSLF